MVRHLQVLFDEIFQCVFVLEHDFDVHTEDVVTVCVLPAEITKRRLRETKQMKLIKMWQTTTSSV